MTGETCVGAGDERLILRASNLGTLDLMVIKISDRAKTTKSQGRKTTGPRFLREATEELPKDPNIAGPPKATDGQYCSKVRGEEATQMKKLLFHFGVLLLLVALTGCGGSKVLKEPEPLVVTQSLAAASDQRLSVTLDWVIVRDGPGTWARNADWDEYLLIINNQSNKPFQVTELVVVDSLNTRVGSLPNRKQLVKGSKRTTRRYKKSGIRISAGSGRGTALVAGATAGGAAIGAATAGGGFLGTGAAAGAAGVLVLVPALAVGGIVRGVNHSAVNKKIEQRQTSLPLELSSGEELTLDVFFPFAPSPQSVELVYSDAAGEHVIVIDTSAALNGLHIDTQHE